ncbi:MAG: branched-chain amino acid transaminase [Gammaproteobacteria bacterium]
MFLNTDSKFIWLNGKFSAWDESKIHMLTHTLHYGMGVFEGVRAYANNNQHGRVFRLQDHTKRLFDAANKIDLNIPFSMDVINEAQISTLRKNKLTEGYIRPIVFLGNESMGLRARDLSVNVAIACWEWPSYMDPAKKEQGIDIIKSPYGQYENPLYSNNKIIGTYVNSIMALHDALRKGADEALLLDKNGNISEGSGENLFIVKDKKLFTPTVDYCLNGITRQSIIAIAQSIELEVHESVLKIDDLMNADEAFFTGTAVEVMPIKSIDNNLIGIGKRGPITEILQSKYTQIVRGEDKDFSHWLTAIN